MTVVVAVVVCCSTGFEMDDNVGVLESVSHGSSARGVTPDDGTVEFVVYAAEQS